MRLACRHKAEQNTYNLPRGEAIRRALVQVFRAQRRQVLRDLGTTAARAKSRKDRDVPDELPDGMPELELGALAVSERMTPLLTPLWEAGGRALFARLRLDPDRWRVTNPHLAERIQAAALAFATVTNATTSLALDEALRRTRAELTAGLVPKGEGVPALTQRVNRIFDGAQRWRARRIAQSEASRAVHAAQEQAAIQSNVVAGWQWLASADACPLCLTIARRATFVRLGTPFAVIGDSPVYAEVRYPPAHPHCCLPETPVVAPLGVAGIKAHYDGPVVRLHLAGGTHVTVTPHHMLMTPDGFAFAHSLVPGDDLLRCLKPESPAGGDPNDDWRPSPIKQVFNAWAVPERMPPARVPVAPEYLHGDAALCQGTIDVVTPHGFLWDNFGPKHSEPLTKGPLLFPHVPRIPLDGLSELAAVLFALRDATDGGVGILRERQAVLRAQRLVAVDGRGGPASDLDTGFQKRPTDEGARHTELSGESQFIVARTVEGDDSTRINGGSTAEGTRDVLAVNQCDSGQAEAMSQAVAGHPDLLGERLHRLAGRVATTKVLDVEGFHYCGPVYDVQTLTSLYLVGDGIVSSNCNCSMVEVVKPEISGAPPPTWAVTLDQPEPEPQDYPDGVKPAPRSKPAATPVATPGPEGITPGRIAAAAGQWVAISAATTAAGMAINAAVAPLVPKLAGSAVAALLPGLQLGGPKTPASWPRLEPVLPGAPIATRVAAYLASAQGQGRLAALRSVPRRYWALRHELAVAEEAARILRGRIPAGSRPTDLAVAIAEKARADADIAADQLARHLLEVQQQVADALAVKAADGVPLDAQVPAGKSFAPLAAAARRAQGFLADVLAADPAHPKGLKIRYGAAPKAVLRAWYWQAKKRLMMARGDGVKDVVHELGHLVEDQWRDVGRRCVEFLEYRTAGETPRPLAELFPGRDYGPSELGRKDRFDQAFPVEEAWYVGKDYRVPKVHTDVYPTEILSKGIEMLLRDPAAFAEQDPEYCGFVLGILDGGLRDPVTPVPLKPGLLERGDQAIGRLLEIVNTPIGGGGTGPQAQAQAQPKPPAIPVVSWHDASPKEFLVGRDLSRRPGFLSGKTEAELQQLLKDGGLLQLSGDKTAGFALTAAGDLQNVFNNGSIAGAGKAAIVEAIARGARTLDCFDGHLPTLYGKFGFVEIHRVPWDDQYAPAGWDYNRYGRPDVVFMEYRGGTRDRSQIIATFVQGTTDVAAGPGKSLRPAHGTGAPRGRGGAGPRCHASSGRSSLGRPDASALRPPVDRRSRLLIPSSRPLGHFTFDAAGTPARAILSEGGDWTVVPVPIPDQAPAPLAGYFAGYLNTLFGPHAWAELPAGMGLKHARLVRAALADLGGRDGQVFVPPAPPAGRVF